MAARTCRFSASHRSNFSSSFCAKKTPCCGERQRNTNSGKHGHCACAQVDQPARGGHVVSPLPCRLPAHPLLPEVFPRQQAGGCSMLLRPLWSALLLEGPIFRCAQDARQACLHTGRLTPLCAASFCPCHRPSCAWRRPADGEQGEAGLEEMTLLSRTYLREGR